MSSEARLAPSDRSSTDKRASISLATRSLGGTLDMGLVSSPVFSSANHFRGTRPFPFYRHSRTLPERGRQRFVEQLHEVMKNMVRLPEGSMPIILATSPT